jgi:hypothetical protein
MLSFTNIIPFYTEKYHISMLKVCPILVQEYQRSIRHISKLEDIIPLVRKVYEVPYYVLGLCALRGHLPSKALIMHYRLIARASSYVFFS